MTSYRIISAHWILIISLLIINFSGCNSSSKNTFKAKRPSKNLVNIENILLTGENLLEGNGRKIDTLGASKAFRFAAVRGNAATLFIIGQIYYNTASGNLKRSMPSLRRQLSYDMENYIQAYAWWSCASTLGYTKATNSLKSYKFTPNQVNEGQKSSQRLIKTISDDKCSYGYDLYKKGQYEKAIAVYETSIKLNPKHFQTHMVLGTIYESQNKLDLAEKHYRNVLNIKPDFSGAANNLAYLLAEVGDKLDEALDFAKTAKRLAPNAPHVMDTLGWAYYKNGYYDNAVSELNECIKKMPDSADVNYHLGLAYEKLGEKEKAKNLLKKALKLNENFKNAEEVKKILLSL